MNRVFESAGPDGKVRGTPQQIIDKYQLLARDAQVSGDRVAAENFLQHAEHYARLLGEAQRASQEMRQAERDDRDEREDQPSRDEGERQQRRPVAEPAALATIDPDEREAVAGPVETPEEAARARAEMAPPPPAEQRPALQIVGSEAQAERDRAPAVETDEAAAPKRPRTRRKTKAAVQAAEASAE